MTGVQTCALPICKVIEGMDVVNKIAEVRTDYMDKPIEAQVMKKVTVETFGVDYPEPETV